PSALITQNNSTNPALNGTHSGTFADLNNASNIYTITVSGLTCPAGQATSLDEYLIPGALNTASDMIDTWDGSMAAVPYLWMGGWGSRVNQATGVVAATFGGFMQGPDWNFAAGDPLNTFDGSLQSAWKVSPALTAEPINPGTYTYAVGCVADHGLPVLKTGGVPDIAFSYVTFDANGNWTDSLTAPAQLTTTTTAVAVSNLTDKTAVLTATVTPSTAAGTVQFTVNNGSGPANVGPAVAVSGGTATYQVTGLTQLTPYSFGANFTPTDSTAFTASNGTTTGTTTATPSFQDQKSSAATAEVPTVTMLQAGNILIQAWPGTIDLTGNGTRNEGQIYLASGTTGAITILDQRRDSTSQWSLNVSSSPLTCQSSCEKIVSGVKTSVAAGDQIAPSYLGLSASQASITQVGLDPSGTAAVTPGANVASDGTGSGLSNNQPIATGIGDKADHVMSQVSSTVNLTVPVAADSGNYTGTITITLL
ncbi:MAG TPA: hypothetical protein VIH37_04310, partial [Candidatus Limnocylindrales bacterium]